MTIRHSRPIPPDTRTQRFHPGQRVRVSIRGGLKFNEPSGLFASQGQLLTVIAVEPGPTGLVQVKTDGGVDGWVTQGAIIRYRKPRD